MHGQTKKAVALHSPALARGAAVAGDGETGRLAYFDTEVPGDAEAVAK